MLRRSLIALAAIALLNLAWPAFAMSIGTLKVLSSLGEPLRVRISVSLDQDVLPGATCFTLAGPSRFSPALTDARLELVTIGGKHYVNLVGRRPTTDPIVDVSLRSEDCGPTMQKDFVVLLSPKGIDHAETTQLAEQPKSKPVRPEARKKRVERVKHPRPYTSGHVKHRQTATSRPSMPAHRIFALRLDYDYESFAKSASQVAQDGREHAGTRARGGDTLMLQSTDDEEVARADSGNSGAPQANGVSAQTVPSSDAAASSGGRSGLGAGPVIPNEAPSGSLLSTLFSPLNLAILGFLLIVALLIAWWFRGRAAHPHTLDANDFRTEDAFGDMPAFRPDSTPSIPVVDPAGQQAGSDVLAGATPHHIPASAAAEDDRDKTLRSRLATLSDFHIEQYDSTDHVIELAEVMLAFGRSNQAIETLTQHIRNNPNQSVEPWLKLLALYHDTNARDEFDALAQELNKHFNVAIANWSEFDNRMGGQPNFESVTLESFPHIMTRVSETWDSGECLAYLDKLIADNRGGLRQGFSLPIVRDILLLRDVLRLSMGRPAR